jgi:hypothetical protein
VLGAVLFLLQLAIAPMVSVDSGCEWLPPNLDGISSEVCGGEVIARRDAIGNVHGNPDAGAF